MLLLAQLHDDSLTHSLTYFDLPTTSTLLRQLAFLAFLSIPSLHLRNRLWLVDDFGLRSQSVGVFRWRRYVERIERLSQLFFWVQKSGKRPEDSVEYAEGFKHHQLQRPFFSSSLARCTVGAGCALVI